MVNNDLFKLAEDIFNKCLSTMKSKNHDYSSKGSSKIDALKNFRLIEHLNVTDASTGIIVRLSDKFSRLANVYKGESKVKDESVKDTLLDIINYCVLLIAILDEDSSENLKKDSYSI